MNTSIKFYILFFIPVLLLGQGSYNSENFGNRSLLLSGNVTGSVEDLGFTYYNPARIALVENPAFTINAKGYQMNSINIKNVFGRNNKLNDSRFEGVPSMLAGTFKIKKWENHHFAYSFISKKRSRVDLRFSRELEDEVVLEEFDDVERFVAELELKNKETDEWFGLTWGTKIKDNFSIGVTGYVSVYSFRGSNDLKYAFLNTDQDVALYNNEVAFNQNSYGMFWKIGLAWKLPKIDLGVNIDLPYLEIVSNGKFDYRHFLAGIGNGDDIFEYADLDNLESTRKVPIGISFGAGLPWGKNKIHLKMDWHNKIAEYDRLVIPEIENGTDDPISFVFKEELRSVINFGIGAEFYLGPKYNMYASFSTDFSPLVTNANIFDLIGDADKDVNFETDMYHLGFGVEMKLKWAQLVLGTTYSTGSTEFEQPIDFPDPDLEANNNDDPSKIIVSRWRFIVGLEIPIFGYDLEFK